MTFAEHQVKRAVFLLSFGGGASCGGRELSGLGKLLELERQGKEGMEVWPGLGSFLLLLGHPIPLLPPLPIGDPAAASDSLGLLPAFRVIPEAHSLFFGLTLFSHSFSEHLKPGSLVSITRGSFPDWLMEYSLGKVPGWVPYMLSSISSFGCVSASNWDLCHCNRNNHSLHGGS